jgi:predicted DNA-binding transcriptional regulator YafY
VYRDIGALAEGGVPVTGEAGVGYSLVKGYHLPPVMFTADEAAALFIGAEMVKRFTDASLRGPMMSAIEKLRAALPRDRQEHVERLARHTVISGHARGSVENPDAHPWLRPVQQAVVERRVLALVYRGRNQEVDTPREVEPLGVAFHSGAWYLVAWCRLRGALRHFRIDRIRWLELRAETVPLRPDFSLAAHLDETVAPAQRIPVRVWFARAAQERARQESYATLALEKERDGGAEFSLFACSLEWIAQWIISFGGEAEAVGPDRLRALVQEQLARLVSLYERSNATADITLSQDAAMLALP